MLLFNAMIRFLRLTASLNKILLFRKGSFDGWCPRGSKLNRRSKEVSSITEERLFPSSSGVIDKIPQRGCPKVQVQDTGQALVFFSHFPLCLSCIIMALPLLNVNLVTNNNIGWQQSSLLKSKLIVEGNQNPLDPNYKRKSKVLRCIEKQRKEACAERSQRLRLV